MNKFPLFLSLTFLASPLYAQQTNADKLSMIKNLDRLAFGSCNKHYKRQGVWKDLIEQTPDLFIWGGDNIYANTSIATKIESAYKEQNSVADYRSFKALVPIIGTWDDHDYGNNNRDGSFEIKKLSRDFALDFLEEPKFSERRLREGLYTSYDFGDEGRKIKIILLDNRYFMNLEKENPLLGKAQWEWLRKEIDHSKASLHLIVSGLSILSPQNPSSEEWVDYPLEKENLKKLLKQKNVPYLYLTGDKHFSSVFKRDNEVEFMSSGMTHNTKAALRPYVRARYPDPVFVNNYSLIDFNWENKSPVLTLTVRSTTGQTMLLKKIRWEAGTWNEI